MHEDVVRLVTNCQNCQINKTSNQRPAGELQQHLIPEKCWDVVTTDFLTELPTSAKGNNMVLVIVDKLSKRAIFIPTHKDVTAPEVAQLFQDHLFTKHGTPITIISDRDPKFQARYWRSLAEQQNVKLNLSTADHPQTDGQSKIMIKTLCNMLRESIQNDQENWDLVISSMEYGYNSSKNASTGLAPFEVDLGRIPPTPLTRSLAECQIQNQQAADLLSRAKMFRQIARDNLAIAQAQRKQHADSRRRSVQFTVGDFVLLATKSLDVTNRADLPRKWRPKFLGPVRVLEVMGPVTYKVELPSSMRRAHNVFHVSKLKAYHKPSRSDQLLPIVVDADGNEEYEVQAIFGKKRSNRRVFYLVHFHGEPASEAVWLPKSELSHCTDLVQAYEQSLRTSTSKPG